MTFSEKLRKAMKELGINQAKVASLTGKSKASVSQYLSGRQIPTPKAQGEIAVALGLAPDYFERDGDGKVVVMPHMAVANGVIPRLDVDVVAKALGMNHNTVRKGLQQGVFPWGYGIKTSENRWVYFINGIRFAAIEGIAVEGVENEAADVLRMPAVRGQP